MVGADLREAPWTIFYSCKYYLAAWCPTFCKGKNKNIKISAATIYLFVSVSLATRLLKHGGRHRQKVHQSEKLARNYQAMLNSLFSVEKLQRLATLFYQRGVCYFTTETKIGLHDQTEFNHRLKCLRIVSPTAYFH